MGNAVLCEKTSYGCFYGPKYNLLSPQQRDYILPNSPYSLNFLTNSYIDNHFLLKKSFQNYFMRNSREIQNFQITISPVNKIEIPKSEREFDLLECESEMNSNSLNQDIPNNNNNDIINKKNVIRKSLQLIKLRKSFLSPFSKNDNKHMFLFSKLRSDKIKYEEMEIKEENSERENDSMNTIIKERRRKTSIYSIFSFLDNISIKQLHYGDFQYKEEKYKYLGNTDAKNNKTGFGVMIWKDKSKLKGNFTNNKINGFAEFMDHESLFSGYYKDNSPQGYGIYEKNNVKTEGETWIKNNLNGIGIQFLGYNDFYLGDFFQTSKFGIGIYHWNDGTICLGEWKEDKMNGYGEIQYSNNNSYIGEFKDNMMDGWGEFLWNDGKYYCGQYKENLKHGFGIYISDFKKYDCYIGFFEYGKPSGLGIKIYENELKIGNWKDGKKLCWLRYWEIKDYLKSNQLKYGNLLHKDIKFLKQFVKNLFKGKIPFENFQFKNIFHNDF